MSERRSTRHYVRRLTESPKARPLLVWFSFLEAIVVPIPLEAVLVPYMLLRRDQLWQLAALALLGFLAAATLGYLLGALAFETVGRWLIGLLGWEAAFAETQRLFYRHGFWALFLIGVLPIPSQVGMLAGGALGFSFPVFMAAMGLSRAIRYFGIACFVALLGPGLQLAVARLQHMGKLQRRLIQALLLAFVGAVIAAVVWWWE